MTYNALAASVNSHLICHVLEFLLHHKAIERHCNDGGIAIVSGGTVLYSSYCCIVVIMNTIHCFPIVILC